MSRIQNICTNCVMDTTDTMIKFDINGICDHCHTFKNHTLENWHTYERGQEKLSSKVSSTSSLKSLL